MLHHRVAVNDVSRVALAPGGRPFRIRGVASAPPESPPRLIAHIPRVVANAVTPEQGPVFLLEGLAPAILGLLANESIQWGHVSTFNN